MAAAAVSLVRELYGYNWASLRSRRQGLNSALDVFDDAFQYQLDPTAFGDRTLTSTGDIETFLQAFEEDFRDVRHRPDQFIEVKSDSTGDHVVVLGEIVGRGRLSGLPFCSPFGHIWTVRDGRAVRLAGFLDHEVALAAAGLMSG